MENYDVKVPKGQINLNTVLGALGTAGFAGLNLREIVSGMFNQGRFNGMSLDGILAILIPMLTSMGFQSNSNSNYITQRELGMEKELIDLKSENVLLKSNIYQDQKSLELYRYVDGKFATIEATLAGQAVRNQGFTDAPKLCSTYD